MRATLSIAKAAAIASAFLSVVVALPTSLEARNNGIVPRDEFYATCGDEAYCAGTNNTDDKFLCGDARLGPKDLPAMVPLDNLVETYDRFGGLCPASFLKMWYNETSGSYIYPPQDGFQLSTSGVPINGNQTLLVGTILDRFGSEYGSFLSPAEAPYNQRALPPSNLDWPNENPAVPFNYHKYVVRMEFEVLSGPIAPWFGQPGQGTQYKAYSRVMDLEAGGYLEEVVLGSG